MYASRCSFGEILLLRDFGIGHPPLYHLLQKLVQLCMPFYHPMFKGSSTTSSVRFHRHLHVLVPETEANAYFLRRRLLIGRRFRSLRFQPMWGLVFLEILLVYLAGERYLRTGAPADLLRLGGGGPLALAANYGSRWWCFPTSLLFWPSD